MPDLAGWRVGRLADDGANDDAFITVGPDWVCEILSPGTLRIDRMKKIVIDLDALWTELERLGPDDPE